MLDPHLEEVIAAIFASILPLLPTSSPDDSSSSCAPSLLSTPPLLHRLSAVIYHLAKVRGHKTVVTFFPHEAAHFEPVLSLLLAQRPLTPSTPSTSSPPTPTPWTTPYALLLWLSILVLVPFDLSSIDSSLPLSPSSSSPLPLLSLLTLTARHYLEDPGPSRAMAAFLLAKLFSRQDAHHSPLRAHLDWAITALRSPPPSPFLTPGVPPLSRRRVQVRPARHPPGAHPLPHPLLPH